VEDFVLLAIAMGATAVATIGGLIIHKTVWEPRRRRRMEREHFRSKLG
jgi:hypothetical protein